MAALTHNDVEWRRLRADQLRAQAAEDAVIILPVAALEQHGPHLPVETDTTLGDAVALRTARRMAEGGTPALVLPCVWSGISDHHMSFGGTITLTLDTFRAVVADICRAVAAHGFQRIVLLNAHGGNESALRVITGELTPELELPIVQLTYWHAAAAEIRSILEAQTALLHACEAETSMMLALRPDLVATDRFPQAVSGNSPLPQGVYRWRELGASTPHGAIGAPAAASAEKGERLLDAISAKLAAVLSDPALWSIPWRAG